MNIWTKVRRHKMRESRLRSLMAQLHTSKVEADKMLSHWEKRLVLEAVAHCPTQRGRISSVMQRANVNRTEAVRLINQFGAVKVILPKIDFL